jgi:hypothetical protein
MTMREHELWLVWGPGGPRDSESGRCFALRLFASLENGVDVFPGQRSMIPAAQCSPPGG